MSRINEVYVTKKPGLDVEAVSLRRALEENIGIRLENVRVFNRYMVKGLDEDEFRDSIYKVFAERNADIASYSFKDLGIEGSYIVTELLPGQFDMRAQAAMDCLSLISGRDDAGVVSQKVIDLGRKLTDTELGRVRDYLINKVEMREGDLSLDERRFMEPGTEIPFPETYQGFRDLDRNGLEKFHGEKSLAMTVEDLLTVWEYFRKEGRDPNETEIRVLDTYWSDHCRHTTFNTELTDIEIESDRVRKAYDRYREIRKELGRDERPVTLMDMATLGARYLKKKGISTDIDESDEINACSIIREISPDTFYGGEKEKYLIQFKNETHNHPTEIEPFGGAATCLGGAIRDPLSGRAFVYQAMRITGAADPLESVEKTLPGKLPQKLITTGAAKGYSSYGNQIGLAAGVVHEIYHPGYKAKRMEVGAVIGSTPYEKVMRLRPEKGDIVILAGGRTGRDGVGGATGSSKSHDTTSIETSGAEVQKGNAPMERKLQRLMRREEVKVLIKKCNDFGAGGVAVAVGELADGLHIDLDLVPLKYKGLNATETAISESQERMAILISRDSLKEMEKYLDEENLEHSVIATVTDDDTLTMVWKGRTVLSLKRDFLDSAGATATQKVVCTDDSDKDRNIDNNIENEVRNRFEAPNNLEDLKNILGSLNNASQRALNENFDSSNGAATKVLPFGGRYQDTESQAMVCHIPLTRGISQDVSIMSFGFDPYMSEKDQYVGAYMAVVESLARLAASGAPIDNARLSFQEYFEKLTDRPEKWGKPMKALLGALMAQLDYEVPAIGGKDSMSGTFNDISVPPTLISFAVNTYRGEDVVTNVLRKDSTVCLLKTEYQDGLPVKESFLKNVRTIQSLRDRGVLHAAEAVTNDVPVVLYRMAAGERPEVVFNVPEDMSRKDPASFIIAVDKDSVPEGAVVLGEVRENTEDGKNTSYSYNGITATYEELNESYKGTFREVFNENTDSNLPERREEVRNLSCPEAPVIYTGSMTTSPQVLIPVFPGSNCEYDLERAFHEAGAEVRIFVLRNRDSEDIRNSAEEFRKELDRSHILMLPGGFSAGDEPDGSGKFIGNTLRNQLISEGVQELIDVRKGLVLGICNGFQALIKLGLVPYGKVMEPSEDMPLLTNNTIGKHMDMISRVRVASTKSPWLSHVKVGEVYSVPISHGEGRFIAPEDELRRLIENGQIITQYCDLSGNATMNAPFNPNGSMMAVEGIISEDGRILGKMGHNERWTRGLYANYTDNFDMKLFRAGVEYFR